MDVQRASLLFVCFTPPNFQKRKFVKRKFGQLEICPAEETFEEEIWAVVWTIFLNNSCFCFTKYMVNRKFKSGFQVKFQLASEDSLRIQPSNTVSGTHSGMTQRMLLNTCVSTVLPLALSSALDSTKVPVYHCWLLQNFTPTWHSLWKHWLTEFTWCPASVLGYLCSNKEF